MKKYLFILLALPLLFSCGNNEQSEADRIKDSLNAINGDLKGQVGKKDSTIESFIKSFNQIQDNLDQIKEKEKIIGSTSKEGDVKNKEEQIVSDIQLIYNLMDQNKKKIAGMSAKLKRSNIKIEELEKMLARLTSQVEEKDAQIADLKNQLEKMNVELSNLQTTFEEAKQESELKTEKMNTVYYAFGTSKELTKQGVLTKEGGFIGIGKTAKLKDDFNKSYFTKVDAATTKDIPLACKKAKVVTSHPSGSYKLEGVQGKKVEKLVITNSDEFWSASKYLIIIVD
jgi:peptidoglycan hydrolase CwlO-like protein